VSEILRDPVWQFIIGLFIAIVTIFVSIIVYFKQRTRKSLSYEIVSLNPLLSVEKEIKNGVQILYRGKAVSQVHLIIIRVINSGNTPILSTDYERPVSLSFGKEARVLTAEVSERNPDSLQPSAKIEEKRIEFAPILLNQGDSITVKTLIDQFDKISIDGRIVGVKNISELVETHFWFFFLMLSALGLYVLAIFSLILFSSFALFVVLQIFSIALTSIAMFRVKRYRRLLREALQ
jgi:hypothetical protein